MAVAGGIAGTRSGALVELLDDIGVKVRHATRHAKNCLAALVCRYADYVVLAPRPNIFNQLSIP